MSDRLRDLEIQRSVLDAQIRDEQAKKMREKRLIFTTILEFLQNAFHKHSILEQDNKYYLDEIKPENEIYVQNIYGTIPQKLSMILHKRVSLRYEENPDNEQAKLVFEKSLQDLQKLFNTKLTIFAPLFYKCHHCGIVPGSPSSRVENTLGKQSLCGHRGSNLHCNICGAYMGADPDSIHCYS